HDTERRQAVGYGTQGVAGNVAFVQMGFDFLIHERFDFEGTHVAADYQTHVVGNKFDQDRVAHDARVFGKDWAGLGFFDVAFDRHQAVATGLVQQHIQQSHELHVGFFAVGVTTQNLGNGPEHHLHGLAGTGCHISAQSRTADEEQFERLIEGSQCAAHEYIGADYGEQNDDITEKDEHGLP